MTIDPKFSKEQFDLDMQRQRSDQAFVASQRLLDFELQKWYIEEYYKSFVADGIVK